MESYLLTTENRGCSVEIKTCEIPLSRSQIADTYALRIGRSWKAGTKRQHKIMLALVRASTI